MMRIEMALELEALRTKGYQVSIRSQDDGWLAQCWRPVTSNVPDGGQIIPACYAPRLEDAIIGISGMVKLFTELPNLKIFVGEDITVRDKPNAE